MKVNDYISKHIQEYPSLYKDVDYEKSKLKVLNQVFFVIGNGIEFADTEVPEQGGYAIEPKYKRDKKSDEWIRIKDKPYGKEKCKPLTQEYFDDIIYSITSLEKPKEIKITKTPYDTYVRYRFKKSDSDIRKPILVEQNSTYDFRPYPFSKNYSLACNVYYNNLFLQDDWMIELIGLCKRALQFYTNETEYINCTSYPSEHRIKYDYNHFQKTFETGGIKELNRLQKLWGYTVKDECPTLEEIKIRQTEVFDKHLKEQLQFLNEFLNCERVQKFIK